MRQYQLTEAVVLRPERFGGMAFHSQRGITLELDTEAYELISRFRRPRPLPESQSDAYILARQLHHLGFLRSVSSENVHLSGVLEAPTKGHAGEILSAPEIVHLALTARCDLTCPGCYAFLGKEMLNWPTLRHLINQLAEMKVFQLALGGGEPTLHPHLIEVVAYARERNIVPTITTHGGHLTSPLVKALYKAGVGQINISLNASVPEHNTGRGERPWQSAIVGLEQLQSSGIATGINCMATSSNLPHLPDMFAFLVANDIRYVTILGPKPAHDPQWLAQHELSDNDQRKLRDILHQWQDHLHITIDCALVGPLMKHMSSETLHSAGVYGCMAAQRMCVIDAKGNVWPCAFQQSPEFCAGNILTDPLQDIWLYGTGFQHFRQQMCGGMSPCYQCPSQ
jgi:mycofactocin biosynthetic radical S-adenosylmethionine protein MftC